MCCRDTCVRRAANTGVRNLVRLSNTEAEGVRKAYDTGVCAERNESVIRSLTRRAYICSPQRLQTEFNTVYRHTVLANPTVRSPDNLKHQPPH